MNLPNKKGLMKIYFHISENSGVGLYREFLIAETLMKQNKANVIINDFQWGEKDVKPVDDKTLFKIANWADVIVVGRQDLPNFLSRWGGIKEFFNMPIIMDTDDNVRFVRPSNPGYQAYNPGSEALHWNKIAFSKIFDAITVSTKELKDFHTGEHPNIMIVPNSLDLKAWKFKKKDHKDDKIRICFNGSASHLESIRLIESSLIKIMEKYKNVIFVTPKVFKGMLEHLPEDIKKRIEYFDWFKLSEFPKKMAELGIDIGLAPLADNMFNRSKSNLRWLEYSALDIPTVVSRVKAYSNVKHENTGLIAQERDEWFDCIEKLILNIDFRHQIAYNAYQEVEKQFNIEINAEKVLPFYKEVIEKYHNFFGKKKSFEKYGSKWREIK